MLCDTDKGNSSELGFASAKSCITSEFNEVYFSERRNFEATRKIPTPKNKFGRAGENAWRFR